MNYKSMTAISAVVAMVAVPTIATAAPVAQANPAASLSVASSLRASAPTQGDSKLRSRGSIIAIVLALGVVAGGIIAVATSNDDNPTSR